MEVILLGIYSFFVWLIFFKFKWLPWNIVSQVIVVTIPIIGLTVLILFLNIVCPSSHDIRVVNYVVPINPPVRGLVTEGADGTKRPHQKRAVLLKVDDTPHKIGVAAFGANLASQQEQVKSMAAGDTITSNKLALARKRLGQFSELAKTGAGNKFD